MAKLVQMSPVEGHLLQAAEGRFGLAESPNSVPSVSPEVLQMEAALSQISSTGIPVLLLGEAGSGKSYYAWKLHTLSSRRDRSLVSLPCASLTADVLASVLGQGGSSERRGEGHKGTIVLDEVADLDEPSQAALLAALQNRPSPSAQGREAAQGGVICTSRRNMEEQYRSGRFLESLYFRISSVTLRIPPLRRRGGDIPILMNWFMERSSIELGRSVPVITASLRESLTKHTWPGNVRELQEFSRQAVACGDAELAARESLREVPSKSNAADGRTGVSLKDAAREASRRAEQELILKTLAKTRWNRKRAAQELMISYKALLYKLKEMPLAENPKE